ncbi:lysoplasmalogenase [Gordonia sp. NPDC003424]
MPAGSRAFAAGYLAAATAATAAGALHRRRVAALTKPLPIALLAARTASGAGRRSRIDTAVLAGALAFSAAGDRAMLLEEFADDPSAEDRWLLLGASMFAGTQLCLTAAMMRRGARPRPAGMLLRTAILAESATVMAVHRPRLLPALGAYGNSLALMSATADDASLPQPRLRIGGAMFLASDLTILNRRHLLNHPTWRAIAETWVLASYFTAQWLLVTGLADDDRG